MYLSISGIRILIKDLPLLKEKIHNDDVRKALNTITEQAKRRPEAKTACQELEDKIKELVESVEDGEEGGEAAPVDPDTQAMPPPTAPVPKSVRTKKKTRRVKRDEDEEEDDNEDDENTSMNNSSRSSKLTCFSLIIKKAIII